MTKVRRFLALPIYERQLVFKAWWTLLGFWVALRSRPFRRVAEIANTDLPAARDRAAPLAAARERTAWCVGAAANHHVLTMGCLERSLTLQRLLRRQGVEASLQIGVQKQKDSFEAHAWIEVDGEPIAEPETVAERFLPILS